MRQQWEDLWWINFIYLIICYLVAVGLTYVKMYEKETAGQLPSLQYSRPLRFLFMVNYQVESFMTSYVLPIGTLFILGMVIVILRRKFRLNWRFRSLCRTSPSFSFDHVEESINSLVRELRKYRSQCLTKGEFYHDSNLVPQKTIYYKKIVIADLSEVEAKFWPNLSHPNVTPLYKIQDLMQETFYAAEIFEWRYILNDILFNEGFNDRKDFFKYGIKWSHDILMGIQYLHGKNLYHLDLEADNVMINFDKGFTPLASRAIIGNFEHMREVCDKSKLVKEIGFTDYYRPPEAFMLKTVDAEKCDMWGLGIIMLELFTGGNLRLWQSQFPIFSHKRRDEELFKMLIFSNFCAAIEAAHKSYGNLRASAAWNERSTQASTELNEAVFWQTWIFVTDLLRMDSHTRISLEQSVQHGFVENVCKVFCDENKANKENEKYKEEIDKITPLFSSDAKPTMSAQNAYADTRVI